MKKTLYLLLAAALFMCTTTTPATGEIPMQPYPTYVDFSSHTRTTMSLNGVWDFRLDPGNTGRANDWQTGAVDFPLSVDVPAAWQSQGTRDPALTGYVGTAWYKRTFTPPALAADQRLWLQIGAVHPAAEVWINGATAGFVRQSGMPTRFDVTGLIAPDRPNTLVLRIDELYRGMGNWYSLNAIWSGVWRDVALQVTADCYIHDVFVIPQPATGAARLQVTLANTGDRPRTVQLNATARLAEPAGNVTAAHTLAPGTACVELVLPLDNPQLWSPQQPTLYTLQVALHENGQLLDDVGDRFGLRSIATRGHQVLLNNQPVYLRGCGDDGMYPLSLHPTTDRTQLRQRMQLIKDCGFNYVYPCLVMQPEEYLDIADEVGLLVQYDAAALLAFQRGMPSPLPTTATAERNLLVREQWEAILHWTQNHPSIVIYSPGSELHQDPVLVEMYHTAKRKDPTRLVLSWSIEPHATDIADMGELMTPLDPSEDLHQVIATWTTPPDSNVPGMIHEYIGAETLADPSLIPLFTSGMQPQNEVTVQQAADRLGLAHLLPQLVVNSQKLATACRKLELEEARKVDDPAGYNMWLIQDIPICPQGIFDAFWQPKEVTPARLAQSNGASVLLMHEQSKQTRRCFAGNTRVTFNTFVSHYGPADFSTATARWSLVTLPDGREQLQGRQDGLAVSQYQTSPLLDLQLNLPSRTTAARAELRLQLDNGTDTLTNRWPLWLLPDTLVTQSTAPLVLHAPGPALDAVTRLYPAARTQDPTPADVVIATTVDQVLQDHLAAGGRALLVVQNSEKLIRTQFMPRWPLSDAVNISATLIHNHPVMANFPHEGFCHYPFRCLLSREITPTPIEGYVKGRAEAINLTAFDNPIEPIIRVWHTEAACAYLCEARVGPGHLLLTSLDFPGALGVYPEADYLFDQLLAYLHSAPQLPAAAITPAELQEKL